MNTNPYTSHYTKQHICAAVTLDGTGEVITLDLWAIHQTREGEAIAWIADYRTSRGASRILEVAHDGEGYYAHTIVKPSYRPKRLAGKARVSYTAETIIDDLLTDNLRGWAVSHEAL